MPISRSEMEILTNQQQLDAHIKHRLLAEEAKEPNSTGHCISCGDPIEEARLKVSPKATTCIACEHKRDDERDRKHHFGACR